MSTVTAKNGKPAIEKDPSLSDLMDEYMGTDELADTLAAQIASMILFARKLEGEMIRAGKKPEDRIEGWAPEEDGEKEFDGKQYRTYKQQFKITEGAIRNRRDKAEAEEIARPVKDRVPEKIKKMLVREEQMMDAQAAGQLPG